MPEEFEIKRNVLIKYNGSSKTPVIPDGVRKIGESAFESAKIDTVIIPYSVKEIAKDAFIGSEIKEIAIPPTVEKIGVGAFSLCSKLRSLKISNGGTKIGEKGAGWIFCACKNLSELNLPADFPRGNGIYSGAGKIKSAELLSSETQIAPFAFDNCFSLREVTIPEGVKKIGYGAFTNCIALRKVVLPEGLCEIGDRAFQNCRNLRTVIIPKSAKRAGANAFLYCDSIGARTLRKFEGIEETFVADDDWD
ncbi:MAG: leucine-rich repeat domain-containing protein [Oscillospiraceae bacterium]|nr:leucine-rich repeat domain-containing protein [Oscillospiraceae bacterium]